jgi:hypothetical protein
VRLSPLGTSAINRPIVPAPYDRWWWMWSSRWNENWQRKPKYLEETCPSVTLPTTNPTWSDLGSNRRCRDGKPSTNRLSYCTANEHQQVYFFRVSLQASYNYFPTCYIQKWQYRSLTNHTHDIKAWILHVQYTYYSVNLHQRCTNTILLDPLKHAFLNNIQ